MRTNAFKITIPNGGGTFPVDVNNVTEYIYITTTSGGAVTLTAAANITASGTPVDGTLFRFIFGGQVTADAGTGKNITLFGVAIPDEIALYEAEFIALYNGSGWQVSVFPTNEGDANIDGGQLVSGSVATAALANSAVTNAKLAALNQGYIKIGNASNVASDLDVSTSGAVLIGNGTTATAQVFGSSGPVTIDPASGATAIGSGTITQAMLAFTLGDIKTVKTTLSSAQMLALCSGVGGTPIELVPAGGAGTVHHILGGFVFLDYNSAAYASGGVFEITYGAGGTTAWQVPAASITAGADTLTEFAPQRPALTTAVNASLYADNATAPFTTGDSPVTIQIWYQTITL